VVVLILGVWITESQEKKKQKNSQDLQFETNPDMTEKTGSL
jgi:hypothetical protein